MGRKNLERQRKVEKSCCGGGSGFGAAAPHVNDIHDWPAVGAARIQSTTATNDLLQPSLFVDTQGLIYAFDARDPLWMGFIDSRLAAGYRLVLAEERVDEFAA